MSTDENTRRQFLQGAATAAVTLPAYLSATPSQTAPNMNSGSEGFLKTRGVVLTTRDLRTLDWPERAARAGLTTIGTHITPREVAKFVTTEKGVAFLARCNELGIEVEHELHAMGNLLPRGLFDKNPEMFRMDDKGKRVQPWNCCVHSKEALEVICEKAVEYTKLLRPTTTRHFYWIDDARPMCRCPKCRPYSDSDQALILENRMLKALRQVDEHASLAHLAYANTYRAPIQVLPDQGIFLEFAPIHRTWDAPLRMRDAKGKEGKTHGDFLDLLDENLAVFGKETAQVLEYWVDVSLFSGWKRPAKKLPWRRDVFLDDLDTYAERGIRHITSFAAWIDEDYVERFGEPPINEYGKGLRNCLRP